MNADNLIDHEKTFRQDINSRGGPFLKTPGIVRDYTIGEICKLLELSPMTVRKKFIDSGKLKSYRLPLARNGNGDHRITPVNLACFINHNYNEEGLIRMRSRQRMVESFLGLPDSYPETPLSENEYSPPEWYEPPKKCPYDQ
jgi:hypothetical protein